MTDTTQGRSDAEVLVQVLGRLGVGQTLRLRRSGPGAGVEVHARNDGSLEVPAEVLGGLFGGSEGGPHVLLARHRSAELAELLVAAVDDLELVTSSILDASGVERLLDGTGARADVTEGVLDRWDLPLIDQVRRYLAQRFALPLSELTVASNGSLFIGIGRLPVAIDVLHAPRQLRVVATIVHDVGVDVGADVGVDVGVDVAVEPSDALDLALHRLDRGEGLVRLRHHGHRVYAVVVLPAPTFMGQHLEAALAAIGSMDVHHAADALAREFGGEAWFRKRYRPDPSHVIDPEQLRQPDDPTQNDPTPHDPEEDHR
jgi:hypothetical protein